MLPLPCPHPTMKRCPRFLGQDPIDFSFTRAIATNHRTCTLNGITAKRSFGSIQFAFNAAMVLAPKKFVRSKSWLPRINKNFWTPGMSSSNIETQMPTAKRAVVSDDVLSVELSDGRAISVPLTWYPRLTNATPCERENWRLIGDGRGIHWPDLDEDVSVENLLAGKPSGESQVSLKRWLNQRPNSQTAT